MAEEKGLYVYGIARACKAIQFGNAGIEQKQVYSLPLDGCSVIVHECAPQAYTSKNEDEVKCWVKTHQDVLDQAGQSLSTIIPMTFNVIVRGTEPKDELRHWIEKEHDWLEALFQKLEGKQEYGVQVFLEGKVFEEKARSNCPRAQQLEAAIQSAPPGKAYFHRQELAKELAKALEKEADASFKEFYKKIRGHAADVKIEKLHKREKNMFMNLSCLVSSDNVQELGKTLAEINCGKGFSVRFTGPWPPYSFVV